MPHDIRHDVPDLTEFRYWYGNVSPHPFVHLDLPEDIFLIFEKKTLHHDNL